MKCRFFGVVLAVVAAACLQVPGYAGATSLASGTVALPVAHGSLSGSTTGQSSGCTPGFTCSTTCTINANGNGGACQVRECAAVNDCAVTNVTVPAVDIQSPPPGCGLPGSGITCSKDGLPTSTHCTVRQDQFGADCTLASQSWTQCKDNADGTRSCSSALIGATSFAVNGVHHVPLAPAAAILSPSSAGEYLQGQTVRTSFSCRDGLGGPGLVSCTDSRGQGSSQGVLDTSTIGVHTYTVTALSGDGQAALATITYTVVGLPTASIVSPASGGTYALDQSVPTYFTCAEGALAPGLAGCSDSTGHTSPSGSLDTTTPGPHTYRVTVVSKSGATGSVVISYTVLPAPPPVTAVVPGSTSGPTASLTVGCQGHAGQSCAGLLTLTARVREPGNQIVGVLTRKHAPSRKHTVKTVSVTVASTRLALPAGGSSTIRLALNGTGRQLLARFYSLTTTVAVSGVSVALPAITFRYPLVTAPPDQGRRWASWLWTAQPCGFCWTAVDPSKFFGVPDMLPTARVRVTCTGVGCPPARSFAPGRRSVKLNAIFAGRHLGPGAIVRVLITAPNAVGRLVTWTTVAGSEPKRVVKCLPPGARKAVACAAGD